MAGVLDVVVVFFFFRPLLSLLSPSFLFSSLKCWFAIFLLLVEWNSHTQSNNKKQKCKCILLSFFFLRRRDHPSGLPPPHLDVAPLVADRDDAAGARRERPRVRDPAQRALLREARELPQPDLAVVGVRGRDEGPAPRVDRPAEREDPAESCRRRSAAVCRDLPGLGDASTSAWAPAPSPGSGPPRRAPKF